MNYKTVFTGTKEKVKGLGQRNAVIIVTDTSSPCKILTGLTHAKFQNTEVFWVFAV